MTETKFKRTTKSVPKVIEEKYKPTQYKRVPSYINALDTNLLGGYVRGLMHLITGLSGHGKTVLAVQQAIMQAVNGYKALFISLEQTDIELVEQLLSVLTNQPREEWEIERMEEGEAALDKREKAGKIAYAYLGDNFHIEEYDGLTGKQLLQIIQEAANDYDAIYVDNFGNLKMQTGDITTEKENISEALRGAIKGKRAALFMLSQLTTNGNKNRGDIRKLLDSTQTKGTKKLEEDAGTWLKVYRLFPKKDEDDAEAEAIDADKFGINIEKLRKGKITGEDIILPFHGDKGVIGEWEHLRLKNFDEAYKERLQNASEKETLHTESEDEHYAKTVFNV